MEKKEYMQKRNYILKMMQEGQYKEAIKEADTVDWKRIGNLDMLMRVSMLYDKCRRHKQSFAVLEHANKISHGDLRFLKRLCITAQLAGESEAAERYYGIYRRKEKSEMEIYATRYRMLRAGDAPLSEQIRMLENLKKIRYTDQWGIELAKRYEEAGRIEDCIRECDSVMLWFGEGPCAKQAVQLKEKYGILNDAQWQKYRGISSDQTKFYTANLASIGEQTLSDYQKKAEERRKTIRKAEILMKELGREQAAPRKKEKAGS